MNNPNIKSKRHALLGALFIAATERGIDAQELRDEIAPGLIGRRLSAASEKQISLVLNHISGPRSNLRTPNPERRYASSMQGLREEIVDLAKARWGETWSSSLNAFCRKFGVDHYNFLNLAHGKAVKQAIQRLQRAESIAQGEQESNPIPHAPCAMPDEEVPF